MTKRNIHKITIECALGDIAKQHGMDAVVNAANAELGIGGGWPLLEAVMLNGARLSAGRLDLESARAYASQQIALLPDHVRVLTKAEPPYPVEVSPGLSRYQKEIEDSVQEV